MTTETLGRGATSPARLAFVHYLRTGRRVTFEQKYNHNHSRVNGQFVSGPGGSGEMKVRLSREEAIENYVDRESRRALKDLYSGLRITPNKDGPVRVIGREYDRSGTDATFRIPDARVGKVAFDVSLTRKTLSTPQIRGFFNGDFRPDYVIIVRPSQLGPNSSYIITRLGS